MDASQANARFKLHAYLLYMFGDILAMCKAAQMAGMNGYCSCRFCRIVGIYQYAEKSGGHVYYPLKAPTNRGPPRAASQPRRPVPNYPADALPMRTREHFAETWAKLRHGPDEQVTRDTGER